MRTAKAFHDRLPLTGMVLTRTDGDARGGAALSMRHVTGLPIKYLGAGEKLDALEVFDANRVAGRILGSGDIVALVERAAADFDQAKTEKMARRLAKGQFDLDDLADQLRQMKKMGGMQGILGMLPGVAKVKKQIAEAGIDDKVFDRQVAIITSMTRLERKKPDILNASRKRRIAKGAGVEVMDLNRLLKQHRQMADAFKMMSRGGGKNMAAMAQALGMGGGGAGSGMPKGFTPPGGMMGGMKGSSLGGGPGGGVNMDMLKALGGGKLPEGLGEETEMPAGLADMMKGLGGGLPGGLGGLPGLGRGLPGPKKK